MTKGTVSVYIRCPYYRREVRAQNPRLICEGVLPGTALHQVFRDVQALKRHRAAFCMGGYDRCPVAQALNRKYGYEKA